MRLTAELRSVKEENVALKVGTQPSGPWCEVLIINLTDLNGWWQGKLLMMEKERDELRRALQG